MTEELKALIENQIEAKKNQELERIEKQLNTDKEVINKAIELINTHTLYKKVNENNSRFIYKLATEEMFKKDYLREPEYSWKKGIEFSADNFSERVNKGVIKVNGETYYDIRYALNSYEKYMNELTSSLTYIEDKIREKRKELELLNKEFPTLKKAIEEWQKYEKENEK